MNCRRFRIWTTLAVTAGAVICALVGLPGAPAACLPDDCDCEAVGPGPVRQPANAWSSLALTATGLFLAIASPGSAGGDAPAGRRGGQRQARWPAPYPPPSPLPASGSRPFALPPAPSRRSREGEWRRRYHTRTSLTRDLAAVALSAAGLGAFLHHAGLTAWTARLDGITVAFLIGALGLHAVARAAEAMSIRGRSRVVSRRQLAAWPLLALGALCWWLGRSGGPWCRPEAWLPAHTAWHLLAAVAIGLWLGESHADFGKQPASPDGL